MYRKSSKSIHENWLNYKKASSSLVFQKKGPKTRTKSKTWAFGEGWLYLLSTALLPYVLVHFRQNSRA